MIKFNGVSLVPVFGQSCTSQGNYLLGTSADRVCIITVSERAQYAKACWLTLVTYNPLLQAKYGPIIGV